MNTSTFVFDAVVMIDVLRIGATFDIDQNVRFDLLEIDKNQRTAITILVEKRKEVSMETADRRVIQLRIIFDLVHKIAIDVILAATLNQNVIGKITLPKCYERRTNRSESLRRGGEPLNCSGTWAAF